jgi:signal transduction histidine kinase
MIAQPFFHRSANKNGYVVAGSGAATTRSRISQTDKEGRNFLLLRYVLIIAAAYLFLFQGQGNAHTHTLSAILIAAALLSNVFLSQLSEGRLLSPITLGLILCSDIAWIVLGLWYDGIFGSDIFFLYFFILFLAVIGQNLVLIISVSVILGAIDLMLFEIPAGSGTTIWTSHSLIRIPFLFVAALFYGHLAEKVKRERKIGEERLQALREIETAIASSLDLQAVLNVLLENIDRFLSYAVTTVTLVNRTSGELEPVACRNLDETEWKAVITRRIPLDQATAENYTPVIVLNAQTDPRTGQSDFLRKHSLVSYLRVPLIAKNDILGFLTFFTKEEHQFTGDEVRFLTTLAREAAIAIHNSQLYEEMSRSNKIKDEFLSVMSHELRTPLNVVMGYTQLLRDGVLGETNSKQSEAISTIAARSKDLLDMINSVLYATSLEAKAAKLEASPVSLKDLLSELKTDYELQMGKPIRLIWDYPSELPDIENDGLKLKQVLQNIINNAIKFTEKGAITISVRYVSDAKNIEFRVADTGIGISTEEMAKIFERFYQVDSSQTRSFGGVGLGLYIVREFTELLGGKLAVESERDKGSTFTVTIPTELTSQRGRATLGDGRVASLEADACNSCGLFSHHMLPLRR